MTQFETTCPNEHAVKFTLEMCGRTAQCPKCSARFEVPTLKEVREMLDGQIDEDLEAEFKAAEIKLREYAKLKAARRAQLEKEAAEKAAKEAAEREAAENAAREIAEREAAEKAAREAAEREAAEKAAKEAAEREAAEKAAAEAAEREAAENAAKEDAEAAEEVADEPMISFLCPNGHELSAPARRTGKKAKCPECGAKFIVPTLEQLGLEGETTEMTGNHAAGKGADSFQQGLELEPEVSADASEAMGETQVSSSSAEPERSSVLPKISVSQDLTGRPFLYPNLAIGSLGEIDLGLEEARRSIPEALRMDPMAKFFWTLWTSEPVSESGMMREQNSENESEDAPKLRANLIGSSLKSSRSGKIELQTADGKVFVPTEFYEDKSLSPIGFFEALDDHGKSVTLVIRWENVVRIVVRGS